MLKYKVGDLIYAAQNEEVDYIAHCCNCFNTMGSGIAPQIRIAFPYAYEADCETTKGDRAKLGTYTVGEPEDWPNPTVFNLYGQYGYGGRNKGKRDLNYDALYNALVGMRDHMYFFDKGGRPRHYIGLPKLGASLAGGDWRVISAMIESIFFEDEFDITIYVLSVDEIPGGHS